MKPKHSLLSPVAFVFLFTLAQTPAANAAELQWTNSSATSKWTGTNTDMNWKVVGGDTNIVYAQDSAVLFDDSVSAGTVRIVQTATITASGTNPGMLVTGTGNWLFRASGSNGGDITGDGALRMEGTGTLALFTAARYSGSTHVAAGTLLLGVANAINESQSVHVANAATLNVGDQAQTLKRLVVSSGARVAFSKTGTTSDTPYGRLTLDSLEGEGGVFDMRVRLAESGKGDADQIIIAKTGTSTGTHEITFSQVTGTPHNNTGIMLIDVEAGSTAVFSGSTEAGAYTYSVGKDANGDWKLFNGTRVSRAAAAVISSAAATGQDWHYSLDALYSRMGELREQPAPRSGNLWMRAYASRVSADDKLTGYEFHQYNYGATLGADKSIRLSRSVWFLGAFGNMGRVDRDFDIGGDGTTDTTGAGLYASWVNVTGWYADITGRFDRNKNKFDAVAVDGFVTSAEYDTDVKGFSLEFGRRLLLNADWWIEPGVQFACASIGGADYRATSPGIAPIDVHIEDSKSTQTRALLRFGEAYGDEIGWHPYAKIAGVYSTTSGGRVRANGDYFEADFDGWRLEVGFGAAYAISSRSQFFYDYEYAWSHHYQRPWSFTAGYRYAW